MSSENCTFTVCFVTEKCLISQLLLFSRLKTDGESTIVTRRVGKNNVFTRGEQAIVISCVFTLIGNCSLSPLVNQIAIFQIFKRDAVKNNMHYSKQNTTNAAHALLWQQPSHS